ncbi:MAG: hypothetical protein AB8B57_02665 [Congregibacter sp.]
MTTTSQPHKSTPRAGFFKQLLAVLVAAPLITSCADKAADEAESYGSAGPTEASARSLLTVTDMDGSPLGGAMISVRVDENRRITRFTDASGRIDLSELPASDASLSISFPGKKLHQLRKSTPAGALALADDEEYRRHLPSNQWLELLPTEDPRKREFTVNCGTCHEVAHDRITVDGVPRTKDQWLAAIAMMRAMDAYEVIPPDFDDDAYSAWLAEHFDAEAIETLTPQIPSDLDQLSQIEITEYALPESGSLPHDLVTGPDGRIWITAFFYDELWALTPSSGAIERFPVDTRPDVNAQPRALEFNDEGILWLVNGGTESVLRFDPMTGAYREISVGMYAHSIDLGPAGEVWVNDYFAAQERVAKVDPVDDSVTLVPVPEARRPASEGLPLPYGLQVDSYGRVYSTQLAANTLVRYDSRDGSADLWEMPAENSGPRRPGLDPSDGLWIPEFNTGHIALFSPETQEFSRVKLGDPSTGLYDVEVNQANGDVWTTGSLASTLIRYVPATGEILTVPLPTEPAYTRHIAIDEDTGDVWTAYSSLPAAEPQVVRLRFLK